MKIRWYQNKDRGEIEKLANKNNILLPDTGAMIVAENADGTIAGFVNLRTIYSIEPLVSSNPMVTFELFNNALSAAQNMRAHFVRAIVKKDGDIYKLAERIGFKEVFDGDAIIELGIDNRINYKNISIN